MSRKKWRKREKSEQFTPDEAKVIGALKTPTAGITAHLNFLRRVKKDLKQNPPLDINKRYKRYKKSR